MTLILDGGRPAGLSVILVRGNTADLAIPRSALDGSMTPWETPVALEFTTARSEDPSLSVPAELTDNGGTARWSITPEQVATLTSNGAARLVAAGRTVAAGPCSVVSAWVGLSKATVSGTFVAGRRGQSAYEAWLDQGNTGTVADFLAAPAVVSLQGDPGDGQHTVLGGVPVPVVLAAVPDGDGGVALVVHVHSQASTLHGPVYAGLDGATFRVPTTRG